MTIPVFQKHILSWYQDHKRDYLPWRKTQDPYHILVSEVMLQQTQVARVRQKYREFLKKFPRLADLARSPLGDVLRVWQGMGYNRRARYLRESANIIQEYYQGMIPSDITALRKLPGVGPYTAGAITCFAFNKPVVFLDTNIRKVYLHFFENRLKSADKVSDKAILAIAEKALYKRDARIWHYALMDYGALALKKEKGILEKAKAYHRQSSFKGSLRYFRAEIIRHLLRCHKLSREEIRAHLQEDNLFSSHINLSALLKGLEKDKLIYKDAQDFYGVI